MEGDGMGVVSKRIRATVAVPEPKSQAELVRQMRQDYQIQLAELVLRSEISAIRVTFSSQGNAGPLVESLENLWKRHLPDMLECIADGRVAFEKDWEYVGGKTLITALSPLPPDLTEMKLTRLGSFAGIKVALGDEDRCLTIPEQSAWWLALDSTAKHPQGRSRFQGAPFHTWKERREAIRLRRLLVSKFVVRGMVGRAPSTVVKADGTSVDTIQNFLDQADALLSGGAMCLPSERDPTTNEFLYDIVKFPEVSDPKGIDDHIDGLDQEQLQAFGIPPKTVLEGTSGSYAMVIAQRRVLDAVVDGILRQIEQSFQEYVIDKVLAANGLPVGSIKIEHAPPASNANSLLYEILTAIMGNQDALQKLLSGVIDINQILEQLRIPVTSDAAKVLKLLFKPDSTPTPPQTTPNSSQPPAIKPDGVLSLDADLNCGTGDGGFQPGNKCQKGGGLGKALASGRQGRKKRSKSAKSDSGESSDTETSGSAITFPVRKSQARVSRTPLYDESYGTIDENSQALFGKTLSDEDYASLVGAPDDAKVDVTVRGNGRIMVSYTSPDVELCSRDFFREGDKLVCLNAAFFVRPESQGKGLGSKLFADQVASAVDMGVKRFDARAVRGASKNGYKVWPLLGYNAKIDGKLKREFAKKYHHQRTDSPTADDIAFFGEHATLLDLYQTPRGRELWSQYGFDVSLTFDLTKNSRNLQTLGKYLAERQSRKSLNMSLSNPDPVDNTPDTSAQTDALNVEEPDMNEDEIAAAIAAIEKTA